MGILKTSSITLSSFHLGEADIACTMFTEESGKRKFLFKGLRKSRKRSKSVAEPGSISRILYYYREQKDLFIVNDYTLAKYHNNIMKDLDKIYHLYYMLEIVEKTTGFDLKDEAMYRFLKAGIDTLADNDFTSNLTAFFAIHLLRMHGILPDMENCKICGIGNYREFTFDITDFKPVCKKCIHESHNDRNRPKGTLFNKRMTLMNEKTRNFISSSLNNKYGSLDQESFTGSSLKDFIYHISIFIESYFHISLKTKDFITRERGQNE